MVRATLAACVVVLIIPFAAGGEERGDAPWQRRDFDGGSAGVYKARIEPHWSSDGAHFWYRNDLADGRREYVLVDAERGERKVAFDHARLAKSLAAAAQRDVDGERLELDDLEVDLAANELVFRAEGKDWRCHLESYELREEPNRAPRTDRREDDAVDDARPGRRSGEDMELTLVNGTDKAVELFWIEAEASERSYGVIAAGETKRQHTYDGHRWVVRDKDGKALLRFAADDAAAEVNIREGAAQDEPEEERPRRERRGPRDESPDGKWTAFVRDRNLFIRSADDGQEFQLSQDGEEGRAYERPQWSPDSQTLVAFRVTPGDDKEVYLVESSPRGGGRARLQARPYELPGDKFATYELRLFRVADRAQIPCDVEPIDFGEPRLRWRKSGAAFTYEKVDRGHQRFRLMEVNVQSGAARSLIDEKAETFIWTAHTESVGVDLVTWLENSEELIYASERDGWRHLYLVDADAGEIKHEITRGEYVVRGIDRIDEEQRQIWFRASGKNAAQDPYLVHYYRVDFDGENLVALTEGDGTHTVQYSADRQYLIDTYSRVDLPPVHELRRAADGKLLCELERADVTELEASGWKPPEVFHAKGRDGQTDIWGIICRPRDFDPAKKYPILEDIYAGPQGSFVPKSFSARDRYRSLNELGFVVVKIDGMGTANRSKAFHDVCWHNLKDGGLEDRILWMKAAAAKDPALDLDRVGVYGTSAGGQNAAAAVLFHPEFYKAAVANCGCHDNRMDKASWNEQWMGYPIGPWYAECSNIDNAHRLQGKLMLVVGELDNNVPPESTYRLVDALIKAGKDFDFLFVPGGGHGAGGDYGRRRMEDFFARHLLDGRTPDRNIATTAKPDNAPSAATEAPLDLAAIPRAANRVAPVAQRYRSDRGSLQHFYEVRDAPATRERMKRFYLDWLDELAAASRDDLSDEERQELDALRNDVSGGLASLELDSQRQAELAPLLPFAPVVWQLLEDRLQVKKLDAEKTAAVVDELGRDIERMHGRVKEQPSADGELDLSPETLRRAARAVDALRADLRGWHGFYNGYDPDFTWWMKAPYQKAYAELEQYAKLLEERGQAPKATDAAPSAETTEERSAVLAPRGDAPSLDALMTAPEGQMPAVIDRFTAAAYRGRGGRRGRGDADRQRNDAREQGRDAQRDAEAASAARAEHLRTLQQWKDALAQLDFDQMTTADRVDYVLLENFVERQLARAESNDEREGREAPLPTDASGISGRPIGREALLRELQFEMIPYTPEELIEIAEREYAWCEEELKRASREMGLGDDWRQAVEKVKSMHVPPGEQPYLIRDLAREAIDYLRANNLVSVPPIAAETWGLQMMSPERQLINPFFTGGASISVSFPTDEMPHDAKLQSMRGNNIPFARATVHHELIPGHNLQAYMNSRYRTYRRPFGTPFWGEGWALYWEMLLYERGFPKTPEDRVGFLVWRAHRCARIVFSLSFHLGRMQPQECIDYLVTHVGFDPHNAAAEVRRSFESHYGPLYQAAYMVGGLQFRALHRELVDSGRMTDREFHDEILKQNSMPVEMVRALLTDQPPPRAFQANWRFYDVEGSR